LTDESKGRLGVGF